MSALRFIRNTLYQLKRRYPGAIDIVRRSQNDVDAATGIKTVNLTGVHVDRAIVLPSSISRAALFDRTYVANDRDFVMGTNFDVTVRTFIVDRLDLPANYEILMGDYIVHQGVRYNIQKIQKFEDDAAFICLAKETLSEPPNLSISLNTYEDLGIISDAASFDPDFTPFELHIADYILISDTGNPEYHASDPLLIADMASVVISTGPMNRYLLTNGSLFPLLIGLPVFKTGNSVFPGRANDITACVILGLVSDTSIAPSGFGLIQDSGSLSATTAQWDAITGQVGGLTVDAIYYLDPITAGHITSSKPAVAGEFVVELGLATDSTHLDINIKAPIGL